MERYYLQSTPTKTEPGIIAIARLHLEFAHAIVSAMEAWRKAALCRAILVLLVVASSAAVSGAQDESCWRDDDHHPICMTEDCMMTCKDHGHADGRCNWSWGRLFPHCQCLMANC